MLAVKKHTFATTTCAFYDFLLAILRVFILYTVQYFLVSRTTYVFNFYMFILLVIPLLLPYDINLDIVALSPCFRHIVLFYLFILHLILLIKIDKFICHVSKFVRRDIAISVLFTYQTFCKTLD